eukprot:7266806-Pyramimonas_sp.AAC.1
MVNTSPPCRSSAAYPVGAEVRRGTGSYIIRTSERSFHPSRDPVVLALAALAFEWRGEGDDVEEGG